MAAVFALPCALAGPVLTPIFYACEGQQVFNYIGHLAKAPKPYRDEQKRYRDEQKIKREKLKTKEREKLLLEQKERIKQLEWENDILDKVNTARAEVQTGVQP